MNIYLSTVICMFFFLNCSVNNQQDIDKIDKPNFLFLFVEDLGMQLGCYGDTVARTPNIDKLASESIMFTNAYSLSGTSAPNYFSFITGLYPTSAGAHHMRTGWLTPDDIPEYSVILQPEIKCFTELLRKAGYYCTNNCVNDFQFRTPGSAFDENSYTAHYRNRPDSMPFFSVFKSNLAHESMLWKKHDDPYIIKPEDVHLPEYFPDTEIIRNDIARAYTNIAHFDAWVGEKIDELKRMKLMNSTWIFLVSTNAGPLPRQKRELYDAGIHIPLLIRPPLNRPESKINHQLISFIDIPPTLLSLAHVKIPDYMHGMVFTGQNQGKPRKYIFATRDRMDKDYDMVRAVRDKRYKYFKNYFPGKPYLQPVEYRENLAMMRELKKLFAEGQLNNLQSLWFRNNKPHEELYDTRNDPHELNNLANKTEYIDLVNTFRTILNEWQTEYGDKGFINEKDMIQAFWNGNSNPPQTNEVRFQILDNNQLKLYSKTDGASISYRHVDEKDTGRWHLYDNYIRLSGEVIIQAKAERIGFLPSEVSKYSFKKPEISDNSKTSGLKN